MLGPSHRRILEKITGGKTELEGRNNVLNGKNKPWSSLLLLAVFCLSIAPATQAMEIDESLQDEELIYQLPTTVELIMPAIQGDACALAPQEDADEGIIDDGQVTPEEALPPSVYSPAKVPFADLTDAELQKMLATDMSALGPMSIGSPNGGALVNGIPMPRGPYWDIVNAAETYGTQETIDSIITAIEKVHEAYPEGTSKIYIGDISDNDGGRLNRHVSHQSGRDVDLSFYYSCGQGEWWTRGSGGNLDLARNWALVRALLVHTDVELILVDRSIQLHLYDYALSIGEDRQWLNTVFQHPNGQGYTPIRHARNHATHYHVRFYNPVAQELGRRVYPQMLAMGKIQPPTYYIYHRVKRGETLGHLARKYGTSVAAIKQANGLRSNVIRAGRSYRIGRRGGVAKVPAPLNLPARHLPPTTPGVLAKADWTPTDGVAPLIRHQLTVTKDKDGRDIGTVVLAGAPPTKIIAAPASAATATAPKPVQQSTAKKSAGKRTVYRVRSGDTLWGIAKRFGVQVSDLKRWNGLRSTKIRPGQKVIIYRK